MQKGVQKDIQDQVRAYFGRLKPTQLGVTALQKIEIRALPRGVWNANFLVQVDGEAFVAKVYTLQANEPGLLLNNSGQQEFAVLTHLAPYGIAPQPILFDDTGQHLAHPILIYRYVPGERLVYSPETMALMAQTYAKLHQVSLNKLDFLGTSDHSPLALLAGLKQKLHLFLKRDDVPSTVKAQFTDYVQGSESHVQGDPNQSYPSALIHADPVVGNIIVNQKAYLIDWQSPMLADPAFDIWAFTASAFTLWDSHLSPIPAEVTVFQQTYLALRPDSSLLERIQLKEPLYLLQYGFHCANRYYDFKANKMPLAFVKGREAGFEKYGPTLQNILARLAEILS